jgi:hypothetical protein
MNLFNFIVRNDADAATTVRPISISIIVNNILPSPPIVVDLFGASTVFIFWFHSPSQRRFLSCFEFAFAVEEFPLTAFVIFLSDSVTLVILGSGTSSFERLEMIDFTILIWVM